MYEKTKALKKQLAACWTPTQVADHFGVTPMTVFNWTEHANLPYVSLAGTMEREGAKRFVPSDVRAWAKLRAGHDFKSDKSAA
jgi:hypothetical protein